MKKRPNLRPTEAELEILTVIWQHGPCTVRFVNEQLNEKKRVVGYTTTLKIMQIMAEKGLLQRDEGQRSHIYAAAIEKGRTQGALVDKLLRTAFAGSASKLVLQALGHHKVSPEEISQIQEFLNQLEGEKK